MNREELEKYVRLLCKQKSFDETKTNKVVKRELDRFDADPEESLIVEVASLPIKGTDDYNQKVDALKAKADSLDTWHKNADATVRANATALEKANKKLAAFEKKHGPIEDIELDDEGNPINDKGKKIPAADMASFQQQLDHRDRTYLALTADLSRIRSKHFKMFGEMLDDSTILEVIGKAANDVNPRAIGAQEAYEALHGERVKAREADEQKAHDQKLIDQGAKAERDRIAREGMRTGSNRGESHTTLFDGKPADKDRKNDVSDDERIAALASDLMNEAAKSSQSIDSTA